MPINPLYLDVSNHTLIIRESARGKRISEASIDSPKSLPILRWAGGKQWLARAGSKLVPEFSGTYFEPFCGGAALFFSLGPQRAVLSDLNRELIAGYRAIKSDVSAIITLLKQFPHDEHFYYQIREFTPVSSVSIASRLIYLNRTCWNGLYRVNSHGRFNTPFGRRQNPDLVTEERLTNAALLLKHSELLDADFEGVLSRAQPGDFAYLDPPYITGHQNNGFLMYNSHLFSWKDQERLATVAIELTKRGVRVLVSNADHTPVVKLYKSFHYYRIRRNSLINGIVTARGKTVEAVLSSYPILGCPGEVIR